jgi:hypothetical protein
MAEVEVISLKTRRPLVAEHPRDHYRELPKGVGGAAWIMLFAGITYVGLFIWLARLVLERMV